MSKGNENKNVVIKEIEDKIWNIVTFLKNEKFRSDDYYVVLLLLSLYKDQLITNKIEFEKENIIDALLEHFNKSNNDKYTLYQPIIESYKANLLQLSDLGVSQILSFLFDIDQKELSLNFPEIFDNILYKISKAHGRYSGEFIQPYEISRFICAIADLPKNTKVYNPFSGLASFGVYLGKDVNYFGQEVDKNTWALGKLRLLAHNKSDNYRYECDDSILNWPDASQKFDLIVSNPPFRFQLGQEYSNLPPYIRTSEQFLIEKGIDALNNDGKLISILPSSFLFNGIDRRIRANLIDKDLIDRIITLPGGILKYTGISLVIIILNKAKTTPGFVHFVNAQGFVKTKAPFEKYLDDVELLNFLQEKKQDTDVIRMVSNEEIKEFDYNLSASIYSQKRIDGVKLGDILELLRGTREDLPDTGKFIRIRDLKDNAIDFTINNSKIENITISRPDIHLISESCLLLAARWESLKPTYFEYKDEPILKNNDILAFRINESLVDRSYLINELHADYVQEQLNTYRTGSTIPYIRKDDLLRVVIKLPSLEEQRAKVKGVIETYFKSKEAELALAKQMQGLKEDTTREFQSIKHTFRQYLSALKSHVSGTRKFIINNQGKPITVDMIYSHNLNQTFDGHLLSINNLIDDLSKLLNNEIVLSSDEYDVDLLDLVNNALGKFKNEDEFIFEEVLVDNSAYIDAEGNQMKPVVRMNESDFNILFSNVITNAINHGFKNLDKKNIIRTFIGLENELCILEISNNGKPIPSDFTLKHLTTRGEKTTDSTGIGSGGADIKSVVDKHNGTMDLINIPNDDFPVKYIFKFPLVKSSFL